MKKRIGQKPHPNASKAEPPHIISDATDKICDDLLEALGGEEKNNVKLSRSRIETRMLLVFKGNPEATEERLQRVYRGVLNKKG